MAVFMSLCRAVNGNGYEKNVSLNRTWISGVRAALLLHGIIVEMVNDACEVCTFMSSEGRS